MKTFASVFFAMASLLTIQVSSVGAADTGSIFVTPPAPIFSDTERQAELRTATCGGGRQNVGQKCVDIVRAPNRNSIPTMLIMSFGRRIIFITFGDVREVAAKMSDKSVLILFSRPNRNSIPTMLIMSFGRRIIFITLRH